MKKTKKRIITSVCIYLLFVAIAVASCRLTGHESGQVWNQIKEGAARSVSNITGHEQVVAPSISASQAVLINGQTGEVLYEKNMSDRAYPASVTKILTVLVAIETMSDLNSEMKQCVKVPAEAQGVEGSSIYLKAGEEVRFDDLLYGAMLRSGNDAATAIAIIIGGSQENFVKMMNNKAAELGCTGSHFENPTGLFNENHYTTAQDMALIAKAAMQSEFFREIAKCKEYTAHRKGNAYNYFYNKNKTVHQYEGGSGIKIGYTEKSGRTLVASAERDGSRLICVVMGDPDWFNDAYSLMDYGFDIM